MKIIIPTKGRLKNQLTLSNLPRVLLRDTVIVAPSTEAFWHSQNWPDATVIKQPDDAMTIAHKRKWIVDTATDDKIVMLDDDLRFAVRREDDSAKFRKASEDDTIEAFESLGRLLSARVPHAGFGARGGGIGTRAQEGGWQEAKRMMYVLGYHVPTVREHAVFGRLSTHEDMDVCLQLLTKGFPNQVNQTFVVDQKFGNPGGCEKERTIEQNNADSLQLAVWFPGYVRTTEKEYSASVNRIEVVCSWQKALADGLLNRKQREQALPHGN